MEMSLNHEVSSHLNIRLEEYDERIRTFVPDYGEMLETVSMCVESLASPEGVLLDLGIGTGALAYRCRKARPDLHVVGIDADSAIMEIARARLGEDGVELRNASFTTAPLPTCDVVVSSLALHHVASPEEKRLLYRGLREALNPGGVMVVADCYLPEPAALVEEGFRSWTRFLELTYETGEARRFLEAWEAEDTYFPLNDELSWLRDAGFETEIAWRRGLFAVVVCI
jgi:tRNA (cmo5U34)-methyltransferase